MIRRILVPTDFSPCSVNAVRYAVALAKQLKVEKIIIMHAFIAPITYGEMGITASSDQITRDQKREIDESFEMIKKAVPELNDINHSTITQQAMLVDALISLSLTSNIDLIIMGTTGAIGIDEVISGTNAYTAIKESKCPVLIVPEKSIYHQLNHIAIASDFKEIIAEALDPVKVMSKLLGSTISIVHISEHEGIASKQANEARKFERYFKNVKHQYHYIKNNDVEKGLDKYLSKHKVDLLTIMPRKHPLLDQVFGGGESKALIFHAKIPILALPGIN